MEYNKYDVITLKNNKKLIIIEKLNYQNITYLYVDEVNEEETKTLKNYQIYKMTSNNKIKKETNIEILTNILPLFINLLK